MFQSVYASTNAFDDGWQAARSDFLDGYEKNSYCDPYNSAATDVWLLSHRDNAYCLSEVPMVACTHRIG